MKFVLIMVVSSAFACTTALYQGPERDTAQVATISNGRNAVVARVDDVRVNGGGTANYTVLPGPHYVELVGHRTEIGFLSNTIHRSGKLGSCFQAAPGHSYDVRAHLQEGMWMSEIIDEESETNVDEDICADPSLLKPMPRPSAAVLPHSPHPGTGFFAALGGDIGGANIFTATMMSGDSEKLDAGTGVFGAMGASVTPLWLGDKVGFGVGGRLGVKYDSIDAKNGSVHLTSYPLSLWIHSYLAVSERWYLSFAGGAHKELSPGLSGDGVASGVQRDYNSPWGWLVDVGVIFAETWHTALGFSLRYTSMRYTVAGYELDASNIGLGLTFYVNL
jgi:hypothetical protein